MSKKDEALKLALEALEDYVEEYGPHEKDSGAAYAITTIREALNAPLAQERSSVEQPAQPIRWDSNAVDMTGAMTTLPKTGSESVVDYKPVISDAGADANIPAIPGTYYGIVPKGTGKITVTNGVQRKPWVGLTEPVGEVFGYYERGFTEQKTLYGKLHNQDLPVGAKLYTSPPASKPWAGLTDEDLVGCDDEELKQALYWENKLKEKNT